jgi:hypothetical protein
MRRYLSTLGTVLDAAGLLACAAAVVLGGFGAWGVLTPAGRRRFNEMAGLIPFAALTAPRGRGGLRTRPPVAGAAVAARASPVSAPSCLMPRIAAGAGRPTPR